MKNLLPGLRMFSERIFPERRKLFENLIHSQKPHTLLITCSDSRIDPNLVTQTQPGEDFGYEVVFVPQMSVKDR